MKIHGNEINEFEIISKLTTLLLECESLQDIIKITKFLSECCPYDLGAIYLFDNPTLLEIKARYGI
ncbi:MAG: hypothetical protein FK734_06610, partial [Asgard group archaeon]|nr:hypothetical protein [Asgard group archaeon]